MADVQPIDFSSLVLPSGDVRIFPSSTFFTKTVQPRVLPTLAEVKAQAASEHGTKVNPWRPPPVRFPSLNLLVKYGGMITIAEGQCLWMIRTYLGHIIQVPEVYGWRRDGEETFIYMELVQGSTLEQRWDELSALERSSICDQLCPMIATLQTLKQSPSGWCIGGISRAPLPDIICEGSTTGPFFHISAFHDWFLRTPGGNETSQLIELHPLLRALPDDPLSFTHGDLHRSNILITSAEEGPARVTAIIDWHQSGWYPAYWEYCKARWTAEIGDEWVTTYLPKIMEPRLDVYDTWNFFVLSRGM